MIASRGDRAGARTVPGSKYILFKNIDHGGDPLACRKLIDHDGQAAFQTRESKMI
jgi:hypothetical protein